MKQDNNGGRAGLALDKDAKQRTTAAVKACRTAAIHVPAAVCTGLAGKFLVPAVLSWGAAPELAPLCKAGRLADRAELHGNALCHAHAASRQPQAGYQPNAA